MLARAIFAANALRIVLLSRFAGAGGVCMGLGVWGWAKDQQHNNMPEIGQSQCCARHCRRKPSFVVELWVKSLLGAGTQTMCQSLGNGALLSPQPNPMRCRDGPRPEGSGGTCTPQPRCASCASSPLVEHTEEIHLSYLICCGCAAVQDRTIKHDCAVLLCNLHVHSRK